MSGWSSFFNGGGDACSSYLQDIATINNIKTNVMPAPLKIKSALAAPIFLFFYFRMNSLDMLLPGWSSDTLYEGNPHQMQEFINVSVVGSWITWSWIYRLHFYSKNTLKFKFLSRLISFMTEEFFKWVIFRNVIYLALAD